MNEYDVLRECALIAKLTFDDKTLFEIEPLINQSRRLVDIAIKKDLPYFIKAACWLAPLTYDMPECNDVLDRLKDIDTNVYNIIKCIALRKNERIEQYVFRVALSPYGKIIVWLKFLDSLTYVIDEQMLELLHEIKPINNEWYS